MRPIPPAVTSAKEPNYFSVQVTRARRFYLNLKPVSKAGLAVVSGGVEHCTADYVIRRRSFPFYALEFVAEGHGSLKFNRTEHRLQAGSLFSYGPGVAHEIVSDSKPALTKYFIDFVGTQARGLLKHGHLASGSVSQVFPPLEIQPLFDELIRCGLRGTPQAPGICAKILEALLLKIVEARAPLPGRETLAFTTYRNCRDHIQRHFLRLRYLEQIAHECHVDNAYLCRLFKRYDHQTPYRMLMRLKMNYAAERLQAPGVLVKQIAEETGFANPFHFSRVFKSIFSASPTILAKMR